MRTVICPVPVADARSSDGALKFLVAKVHPNRVLRQGPLSRDFSLEFRWYADSTRRRQLCDPVPVRLSLRKNRGLRWDWQCWDPFTKQASTLHRVALKVKTGDVQLIGLNADHNTGPRGWHRLRWAKLRAKDADEYDPDAGGR